MAPRCRPVTAEERAAAEGAVAHEATMLALMLSNACLVHKLGRAVQLVRLHCELQCAVLSGRYGADGRGTAGAGGPDAGMACGGRGASRMLQLWDYEGSLGRQVGGAWCKPALPVCSIHASCCLGSRSCLQSRTMLCPPFPLSLLGCRSGMPSAWPSGGRWGDATVSSWRQAGSRRAAPNCGSR